MKMMNEWIFAMSDIHAHYDIMQERIEQIIPAIEDGGKLILLGDYIDRGKDSYRCLQFAYDLQEKYGEEKVIVLKGNHEEWFIDFILGKGDEWLTEDDNFNTTGTFLTEEQRNELRTITSRAEILSFLRQNIKKNHKDLLNWTKKLFAYYETSTQIFVHAGVDEEIPEEEIDFCTLGTPDYVLTGKFPPSTGHFYKDIIAGHVAARTVADDPDFKGIYFDGESHFYIDGSTTRNKRLLCLAYDDVNNKYYELMEDGRYVGLGK